MESSIKIVHVTSSLRVGGAEKILYQLVRDLRAYACEQTVFYFHEGPYAERLRSLGVTTTKIEGGLFLYDPLFFLRLYRAICQEQPTIVHSLLWSANVATRMVLWFSSVPIISAYHNNVDQDGTFRSLLDRLTLRRSSRLIAVSMAVATSLIVRSLLAVADKIVIIRNGIDLTDHDTTYMQPKEDLSFLKDKFVIGAVGRFVPVKRFEYLLQVFAQCKRNDLFLLLIGEGELEDRLRHLAVQLMIQKQFLMITNVSALPYYQLFDCFVQPSIKEGISLALLEAMLCETSCIVMGECGEHPVISNAVDGLIVPPDDKEALISALYELQHNHEKRAELGKKAQIKVRERFDAKHMTEQYYTIFLQFVKPKVNA